MGVSGIRREPVAVARKEAEIKKDTLEVKKDVPEAKKEVTRMPSVKTSSVVTTTTSTMPTTMSLSSKRLAGIEDIDANDKENLVLVSEYVNDIYDYLYQVELQQPIHKDHLEGQKEVSHKMRAVLIDWIIAFYSLLSQKSKKN